MKVSKKVLGALVVGLAVQASSSSCDKAQAKPEKAKKVGTEKPANQQPDTAYNCPACGMG